jgi:hypothetical protein
MIYFDIHCHDSVQKRHSIVSQVSFGKGGRILSITAATLEPHFWATALELLYYISFPSFLAPGKNMLAKY